MSKVNWKKYSRSIPDRVQTGAKSFYDVLWTETFNNAPLCGTTTFDPKQITIRMGMAPKLTVATYIHEILHAVSEDYEIGLTENQILKLEKSLHYVFKPDNVFITKGKKNNVSRKRTKRIK